MAQAVSRLFKTFQQADDTIASTHGGTGLGLNISRDLAELMGGDITVQSTPGVGTTFTVTIKAPEASTSEAEALAATTVAAVEAQKAEAAGPVAESKKSGARAGLVLVADDTPDVLALTVYYLKKMGIATLTAKNGQEALDLAMDKSPDVILMDMEMPVLDGVEATRMLRGRGFAAPILALTANKADAEKQRALAAGCNAVLEKPVTNSSLRIALESALAR